jgi:hypothetical protein
MVVHYYKRAKQSPKKLKHKVLSHEGNKVLKKKRLKSNSVAKSPAVSSKHFHRGRLNSRTARLYVMAILLFLK